MTLGRHFPITVAPTAEPLRKYAFLRVTVEGHCDDRGTVGYNLALGERRAEPLMDPLALSLFDVLRTMASAAARVGPP